MPLTKLEYTRNIALQGADLTQFFTRLHQAMVEVIQTELASCKSWSHCTEQYTIADNVADSGFMILSIQILPGRTSEQKQMLQTIASEYLHELLRGLSTTNNIAVRVLLTDADLDGYHMSHYAP